jgi:hypothetical protein
MGMKLPKKSDPVTFAEALHPRKDRVGFEVFKKGSPILHPVRLYGAQDGGLLG